MRENSGKNSRKTWACENSFAAAAPLPAFRVVTALVVLVLMSGAVAEVRDEDDWLAAETDADTSQVNDGQLDFLAQPPRENVHHHRNRITLTAGSLADGWADLYQCHENLDEVSSAEIVFNPEQVRKLRVISHSGIGEATVEGASVQLAHTGEQARLCLQAESRVIHVTGADSFSIRNGPYMRRFLDGYYPMHVSIEVRLPSAGWVYAGGKPAMQPGFIVKQSGAVVEIDAWFEGELRTDLRFERLKP
jgi:hypothetical protein